MQESLILRTNRIAQINTILTAQGGLPLLKIFGAPLPVNCAAGDPGNLLCTITLPASPLGTANGQTTMIGQWSGTVSAGGLGKCFRMYDAIPTCHVQGYISEAWAPLTSYALGQQVSNINGVFVCTNSGLSNSVGNGPSGIGSGIIDGSVVWSFLASQGEMILGSTVLNPGISLPVQSFSIIAGNA